jgi:transcriptional regulator with XRE-family HTH domain
VRKATKFRTFFRTFGWRMSEAEKSLVPDRIRAFREHLRLSQNQMAEAVGGTPPGYKKNELGVSLPNSKLLIGLGELGVNLNWLLLDEGPMLRSELLKPVAPAINEEALVKAFEVMTQTAKPGETPRQTAKKAVEFYMYLVEKGMITPEGIGEGKLSSAA